MVGASVNPRQHVPCVPRHKGQINASALEKLYPIEHFMSS